MNYRRALGVNHYGYAYDPIGNRTAATNNGDTTTYTANQLNQYTAISDGVTIVPTYDIDGNLTNDSHFYYTWDAENRMVLASNATTVVSNSYDYMSRRTRTSVFTKDSESWPRTSDACFEYDGWNLVRELITDHGSPITNIYVWGLDLAEQSGAGVPRHSAPGATAGGIGGLLSVTRRTMLGVSTYYPSCDANGNISDYVDAGGTVVAHREYDAYGNTVVADGAMVNDFSFWFSTKYLDKETGLYYYGLRCYNPSLGRFLNRDPIEEVGGINVYGFVGNGPIDRFDELGLACSWAVGRCVRNVGNVTVPSTVTIGGHTFSIPQWIRNAVSAAVPDHHNVKVESYKMPNCVIGSVIEESIIRGFFADSFGDSLTHYAVSLIPFIGVSGWVPGHVWGDPTPGSCSMQCVSKDRFDLVKQRITTAPNQNYHLTHFNCQHWAAQQLR